MPSSADATNMGLNDRVRMPTNLSVLPVGRLMGATTPRVKPCSSGSMNRTLGVNRMSPKAAPSTAPLQASRPSPPTIRWMGMSRARSAMPNPMAPWRSRVIRSLTTASSRVSPR